MAETNRVEARLLLRYATYNQWMSSSVILLPGEAAIAYFPQLSTLNATDNLPENTPPAIGIKIGDGYSYFYELPWVQAPAADVYNWAKQPTPPAANTIPGLSEYVAAAIENSGGGSGSGGGTSSISAYRIIYDSANSKYVLQAYDDTTQAWINTTSEINLSSILNRITGIENWANGAFTNIGNIDIPLLGYIQDEVVNYINQLDNNDEEIPHQFVTSVTQTNGLIAVTRSSISIGDLTGVLSTEHGGTGLTRVEDDELLIGSADGTIQPRQFVTHIEEDDRSVFATAGAIIDYVLEKTAGLTGAMHYIGEATVEINPNINPNVNPNITGYDFSKVRDGDVITYNYKEYVWAGGWRLLGDEGSYAVKGSITNNDIAENAYIAQYKIDGLEDTLNTKVDKVEGKGLSTNDYTDEEQSKLADIEPNAQVNIIEHVFFNDEEIQPTIISGTPKSIDLHFNGMTEEQSQKLADIEAGAQVNVIEHIKVNNVEIPPTNKTVNIEIDNSEQENIIEHIYYDGVEQLPNDQKAVYIVSDPHEDHVNRIESIFVNDTEQVPDQQKAVRLTLNAETLQINTIEGAIVPNGNETEAVTIKNKKLELERIAKTGDVKDLLQTENTYITFDCGSSTDVI